MMNRQPQQQLNFPIRPTLTSGPILANTGIVRYLVMIYRLNCSIKRFSRCFFMYWQIKYNFTANLLLFKIIIMKY